MHLGHEFVPTHEGCVPGIKHPKTMYCETQLGLLHEQATEAEAKRWFERLELLPIVVDQDGSGTDTGDSLDVIEAEINMATGKLVELLEEFMADSRVALAIAKDCKGTNCSCLYCRAKDLISD